MVFLHHKNELLSSEALAENICTNPARVRKIMAKLGKAGLIETKSGRSGGGYTFQRGAYTTLRAVAQSLELNFVEAGWHSGDPHMDCQVASGMAGYMDHLYGELDALCKDKLAQITIADVADTLFEHNLQKTGREAISHETI